MATTGTGLQPQLSPALLFDTLNAYQRTATLKAAIELDVFTAIGEGSHTAQAIADRCQTSQRGMRTLCDYLVVTGFLTKQDSRYGLTPDSAMFLDRRSPAYMGAAARFLASPQHIERFNDMAEIVRKGGSLGDDEAVVVPENPLWVEFAHSMAPMMRIPAEMIAGIIGAHEASEWKVLDIAAGHGLFGIAIAHHNPNAEVVALDWPNVLEVAKENAGKAGVADRYRTISGSAFEVEFGNGYDVVLITNFLHHFDIPTCEGFLRKVHAALKPGGRTVTLEFVPNEDRVSPPQAAAFSLMMLGATPAGDAYTFSELDGMFRRSGFRKNHAHPLDGHPENLIVSEK